MGYNLYITRRENWSDETGPDISAAEWLALVEGDDELELQPENGAHFANCRRPGEPEEQWLDLDEGNLFTKNPEKWFAAKMIELAEELSARVVGDEDEEYTPETLDHLYGDDSTASDQALLPYWVGAPYRFVRRLLRHRLPKKPAPPYRVGDRVQDAWGQQGTVVKLQRTAEFGYGRVVVEFDNGHRSSAVLTLDSFQPIGPSEDSEGV